jgi:hypothetical protein
VRVEAKVDDKGLEAHFKALWQNDIAVAVQGATKVVSDMVKADMAGPQGLQTFPKHARGTKTPATPGGPPAQVTGYLAGSVKASAVRKTNKAVSKGKVGPTMKYARPLDRGSMHVRHNVFHSTNNPDLTVHDAEKRARAVRFNKNLLKSLSSGRTQPPYPIIKGTRQRLFESGKVKEVYVKTLNDIIIPKMWKR